MTRRILGLSALLATLMLGTGCAATAAPAPSPDPFSTVSQRAAQLRQEGRDLREQGRTQEALEAFRRAQLLSPSDDPDTDATVTQLSGELAPTRVPVPPTATPSPQPTPTAEPQPTQIAAASARPATTAETAQPATIADAARPAAFGEPARSTPVPAPLAELPEPRTSTPPRPPEPPQPVVPTVQPPAPPQVVYVPVPAPTATPTAPAPELIYVADRPAAIALSDSGQMYVADHAGAIWTVERAAQVLRRPFSVPGEPVGLAIDDVERRLYVATRGQPAIVVLDATTGQQLASVALNADPGNLKLDQDAGVVLVVIPGRDRIERFDAQTLHPLSSIDDLAGVTGLALDATTHALYVSQLDGRLAILDVRAGAVRDRRELSGIGLASVAAGGGRIVAVNTPGQELLAIDPDTGEIGRVQLDAPPVAVGLGATTGLAYVLEPSAHAVVCIDVSSGTETRRLALGDVQVEDSTLQVDQLWARPRIAIAGADETILVMGPAARVVGRLESGTR